MIRTALLLREGVVVVVKLESTNSMKVGGILEVLKVLMNAVGNVRFVPLYQQALHVLKTNAGQH